MTFEEFDELVKREEEAQRALDQTLRWVMSRAGSFGRVDAARMVWLKAKARVIRAAMNLSDPAVLD
jgi:hypothetical protein